MTAVALTLSVVSLAVAGLVGWRWWLVHAMALATMRKAEVDASIASLPGRLRELESRVTDLEYREK